MICSKSFRCVFEVFNLSSRRVYGAPLIAAQRAVVASCNLQGNVMSQYVRPGCLCPSRHRVLTSRWHAWAVNAPFWAHPLQLVGMSEIRKYVFKSPWHAVCGDEGVALASGYSVRRGIWWDARLVCLSIPSRSRRLFRPPVGAAESQSDCSASF